LKPCNFKYIKSSSINEVLDVLDIHGEKAQILAGGQSLISMLNMRIANPEIIIDINFLKDVISLENKNNTIGIGPLFRQLELENWPDLKSKLPLIYQSIPYVGQIQHRARGTVLGSICHGDPTSELPLCFLALNGKIYLKSKKGLRSISANDFYLGPLLTSKNSNEVAIKLELPTKKEATGYAFNEVSEKYSDYAIASFAVVTDDNKIRFTLGGIPSKPTVIEWNIKNFEFIDELLNDFAWNLDIEDDQHASATYKRDLIRKVGKNTILSSVKNI
jgi:2-furoyl-CoA dehydrogenase FAD binding subunit